MGWVLECLYLSTECWDILPSDEGHSGKCCLVRGHCSFTAGQTASTCLKISTDAIGASYDCITALAMQSDDLTDTYFSLPSPILVVTCRRVSLLGPVAHVTSCQVWSCVRLNCVVMRALCPALGLVPKGESHLANDQHFHAIQLLRQLWKYFCEYLGSQQEGPVTCPELMFSSLP